MSVVILGGNECMERRYRELCESYQCQSKIFTKPAGGLRNKLGSPDLTIFFTNTICLLYTSPSPRDRYASRMPSSA